MSEDLPFGTRGGTAFKYYFPSDGEYVITITLQKFDHLATHPDGSRDYWSIDDWSFFLSDLKVRQAKDDGTIYLELNTEKQKGIETYNPHLLRHCDHRTRTLYHPIGSAKCTPKRQ